MLSMKLQIFRSGRWWGNMPLVLITLRHQQIRKIFLFPRHFYCRL